MNKLEISIYPEGGHLMAQVPRVLVTLESETILEEDIRRVFAEVRLTLTDMGWSMER